jgi:hypothetical protein
MDEPLLIKKSSPLLWLNRIRCIGLVCCSGFRVGGHLGTDRRTLRVGRFPHPRSGAWQHCPEESQQEEDGEAGQIKNWRWEASPTENGLANTRSSFARKPS